MKKGVSEDDSNVQLITFGRRDPVQSLERRKAQGGSHTEYLEPWSSDALMYGYEVKSNGYKESGTSDQEAFLPPVKLDPGFDSIAHASQASSHHTQLAKQIEEMENNTPNDRYKLIYIVMMIHGIAVLIPWNMFINAKSYFEDYKLNQGNASSKALQDYRINFMSYVGMASQYPNFIMNLINLFAQCGGNTLGIRVLSGIIISVLMFILTVILAMIDTNEWPETFFWITMGSVVVINCAAGIYQNSMFGIVAILPMKYTNAVIFGNNISGTLVAIINIIVIVLAPDHRTSAIYYFVVAIVILMVAFDAYFLTSHSKFYRHYVELHRLKELQVQAFSGNKSKMTFSILLRSFKSVFAKIWHLLFGIWFTFVITLALFPAVMSDIKPLQIGMSGNYWTAIFCFLFFNFFASLGNLTTEFIKWPNARWINLLVVARFVFVPLMILGNFRPELRTLPIYLDKDWIFIVSAILFSFTSGYCSSLVMMYAPKLVPINLTYIAGMMMAFSLATGVFCGVNFSRISGVMESSIAGMMMALFLIFGILCGINISLIWSPLIGVSR